MNKNAIEHEKEFVKWSVAMIILLGILAAGTACLSTTPSIMPHAETVSTLGLDRGIFSDQYAVFYSTVSHEETSIIVSIWRTYVDGSDKLLLFQDARQRRAMGTPTPGPLGEMEYYLTNLVISPDRTQLAFVDIATHRGSTGQPNNSVWVMNADGSNLRELARLDFLGTLSWSPDSSKLLFNRKGKYFWTDVVSGDITEVGEWGAVSWSPNGVWLAAALWRAPTQEQGIYVVSLEGWNYLIWSIAEIPDQDAFVSDIAWSPNGDKIAFAVDSTQPGCFAISPEGKNLGKIANGHCSDVRWSPDGSKLSFSLSGSTEYANGLYVMEVGKEPRLVQKRSVQSLNIWSFDSKAVLSYKEESKLEAIFIQSQEVIQVSTEDGLVSFTW